LKKRLAGTLRGTGVFRLLRAGIERGAPETEPAVSISHISAIVGGRFCPWVACFTFSNSAALGPPGFNTVGSELRQYG
jgi:hypothetical protein